MITFLVSDPSPYWTYEGLAVVGVLGALVVILVGLAVRRGIPRRDDRPRARERLLGPTAAVLAVVSLVAAALAITRETSGLVVLALVVVGGGALVVVARVRGGLAIGRVLAVIQGAVWLALLAQSGLGILLGPVAWGAAAAARLRPVLAGLLLALPSVALAATKVVEGTQTTDPSPVIVAVVLSLPGLIAAGLIGVLGARNAT
jgi:hypothetical protein